MTNTRSLSTQAAPSGVTRRQVHTMLLLAALGTVYPAATRAQAAPPPPYRVTDFDWWDPVRARPVPVRLYWPTAAQDSGAPVPLVVFSHGIGGSREGYSYLGKHWSSQGIASLHVQHVGSDAALWRGNPFGVVGRLQAAAQDKEAIARAADVRFALDQMLSGATGGLGEAVDRQRIVAAGHSYGANTTLLSVGAQVVREGLAIDCRDPRFAAAVIMSAPPFYGESDLAAVLQPIHVPTVHITTTDDVIEIPGYRSGAEDRLAIFDAVAEPRKLLAVFQGGSHSIFTDRTLTGGAALNAQVKAATAELTVAFFDWIFEHSGDELQQWQAQWRPILAQASGAQFSTRPVKAIAGLAAPGAGRLVHG